MGDLKETLPEGSSASSDAILKVASQIHESEVSSLREEIRKSEEARLDFLKYKLIAVASLAAVAFGLESKVPGDFQENLRYILALVPFVCIYVDALCYHNNLRILVIAKYLRCHGDSYEEFLDQWGGVLKEQPKKKVGYFFEMEGWVLDASTQALATMVAVAGLFSPLVMQQIAIYLAGLIGLILSIIMKGQYSRRDERIFQCSCVEIKSRLPSGT